MVDYKDMSRKQMIRSISARLKRIDPDENVLISARQVRDISDVLSYIFKLGEEYRELFWPNLRALLLVVAPKMAWAGYREQEWIRYIEQAIVLSRDLEDEQTASILNIELGRLYERLGDFQQAEQIFLANLACLRNIKDEENETWTLVRLAHIAYLQDDFDEAKRWVDSASGMNKLSIQEETFLYFVQGALALIKREHEEAIVHFKRVLNLRQAEAVKRHIAVALNDLGVAFHLYKEYEQALGYLKQALIIYQEVESPIQRALTQMNIGCIYADTDRGTEGLDFFPPVEKAFHQSRDKYKLALLYNNWGRTYYTLEQLESAEHMYHNALNLWEELGVLWHLVHSMGGLGLIYIQRAERQKAIHQFKHCLQKLLNAGDRPEYRDLHTLSVECLRQAEALEL